MNSTSIDSNDSNDGNNNNMTSSWANIVDAELSKSITDKLLTNSGTKIESTKEKYVDPEKSEKLLSMSEIISLDYKSLTDVVLSEYQYYVAKHLNKYVKNCNDNEETFDYDLHLHKIVWLYDVSKYLSEKFGQKIKLNKQNNKHKNQISRSSYKFCKSNYECNYYYGVTRNNRGCYDQHFVHNLIYADIVSLYNYLVDNKNEGKQNNFDEIVKCFNTITFVLNHMYEELKNAEYYGIKRVVKVVSK